MTEQEKKDLEERETKNKFWKGVLVGALVTAFSGLIAVGMAAGIWIVARGVNVDQGAQVQTVDEGNNDGKLDMAKIGPKLNYMQELINQYFLFDAEEREDPEEWIYSGLVYSLQDPYSVYYTPEEYESVVESNEGEYCGIGVQVSQNVYTGIITVVKVFKGTPAERAGMLPGDILTAVGDMDVSGLDLSLLVSDYIKGEEGTEVSLTVYRESTEDYVEMTMERAMVENPTVEYTMLEDKIGYISLSSFEEVSGDQFKKAVDFLEEKEMEGLVVDLRNNGGGVVNAAKAIADYLLPEGDAIVSFKGKGVPDSSFCSEDGHQVDVPIVVLVNGQSASASEVLTGALKDNDWGIVVGTKTFGKGIAQGVFPMMDGSAVKLTTAYYYVPSGECIHELGIEPDVEVELREDLRSMIEIPKDEDNQLKAAVGVLLRGTDAVKKELEALEETAEADAPRELLQRNKK